MMPHRLLAILFCLLLHGCVIVDTGATNPFPGMSKVAVVPFRNLTTQPDGVVDGRRFAITYASELQKVPGFEVVPVGVTEVALLESGLEDNNPDDLLQLAGILNVDAVVVGAVTDYDPYYPPRIGMQVEWLSPHLPGRSPSNRQNGSNQISPSLFHHTPLPGSANGSRPTADSADSPAAPLPPLPDLPGDDMPSGGKLPLEEPSGKQSRMMSPQAAPTWAAGSDPTEPLMAYTRFFDGADTDLTAELRDYVELYGDLRTGGWKVYLQRSDDFIRFCCHRMIEEMLILHGGEGRRRIVVKLRKYR